MYCEHSFNFNFFYILSVPGKCLLDTITRSNNCKANPVVTFPASSNRSPFILAGVDPSLATGFKSAVTLSQLITAFCFCFDISASYCEDLLHFLHLSFEDEDFSSRLTLPYILGVVVVYNLNDCFCPFPSDLLLPIWCLKLLLDLGLSINKCTLLFIFNLTTNVLFCLHT